VPVLRGVVELIAVVASDVLPGEILDRGQRGLATGLEDRRENRSGTGVQELDIDLAPPALEAVEQPVLEQGVRTASY